MNNGDHSGDEIAKHFVICHRHSVLTVYHILGQEVNCLGSNCHQEFGVGQGIYNANQRIGFLFSILTRSTCLCQRHNVPCQACEGVELIFDVDLFALERERGHFIKDHITAKCTENLNNGTLGNGSNVFIVNALYHFLCFFAYYACLGNSYQGIVYQATVKSEGNEDNKQRKNCGARRPYKALCLCISASVLFISFELSARKDKNEQISNARQNIQNSVNDNKDHRGKHCKGQTENSLTQNIGGGSKVGNLLRN